jgi:hypothetical protein
MGGEVMLLAPVTKTPAAFFRARDWEVLFGGASSDAFRGKGQSSFPTSSWTIVNGELRNIVGAPATSLLTKSEYESFELSLEWAAGTAGANSGIFYRYPENAANGLEFQLYDSPDTGLGRIGALWGVYAPTNAVLKPLGEFNEIRLLVAGNHVEHWLNGTKVVEYELNSTGFAAAVAASSFSGDPTYGQARQGHIELQFLDGQSRFRNIRISPIPAP